MFDRRGSFRIGGVGYRREYWRGNHGGGEQYREKLTHRGFALSEIGGAGTSLEEDATARKLRQDESYVKKDSQIGELPNEAGPSGRSCGWDFPQRSPRMAFWLSTRAAGPHR